MTYKFEPGAKFINENGVILTIKAKTVETFDIYKVEISQQIKIPGDKWLGEKFDLSPILPTIQIVTFETTSTGKAIKEYYFPLNKTTKALYGQKE